MAVVVLVIGRVWNRRLSIFRLHAVAVPCCRRTVRSWTVPHGQHGDSMSARKGEDVAEAYHAQPGREGATHEPSQCAAGDRRHTTGESKGADGSRCLGATEL